MSQIDPEAPICISGVGGSGTRVVTDMLIHMGYFMGDRHNSAFDNLWFRFLLKRPEWYMAHRAQDPALIRQGLRTFTAIMTGPFQPTAEDRRFIWSAVKEQRWRGVKRARKLFFRPPVDYHAYRGWGWKEPSAHLYLDHLFAFYPRMKYIHLIRHGLDMAFSQTTGQLEQWAPFFGLQWPADPARQPPVFLEFWIQGNRRALAFQQQVGPERFHVLHLDDLCAKPAEETDRLLRFLDVSVPDSTRAAIAALPRSPSSSGRYQQHDLSIFTSEQLAAVQELGFAVTK